MKIRQQPVSRPCKKGQSYPALDQMVQKGEIDSYYQENGKVTVQTNAKTNRQQLDQALAQPAKLPLLEKASQLFVPPDMDENCAPEYLKFRLWQLGGAVCGGALGFLNAQINLNSLNSSFSNTESAALAGTIVGTANTFASMGASFLARRGDADPKRAYMNSTLIATGNTLASMAGMYFFPRQYMSFSLGSTLLGAAAGGLGGSAGVNIANHMAKEHARGTVGAKNGNQDRAAGFLGVPLALAVSRGTRWLGWNPTVASMGILGVALLVCNLQSAAALRFESVDRKRLETLVASLIDGKQLESVPKGTLLSMFSRSPEREGDLKYLENPAPLLQNERIRLLAKEDYLVGLDAEGRAQVAFRKNIGADGLIAGAAHALLLQRCIPWLECAEQLAPGKGELLLTELSYRALPREGNWKEKLSQNGWHVHAEKLKVGSDEAWKGVAHARLAPVDLAALSASQPSVERLRSLLAGSPLL